MLWNPLSFLLKDSIQSNSQTSKESSFGRYQLVKNTKYWLGVLNEIKNRGVEEIMIVSVDGLTGFGDAINAVFSQAEIQRCIVHQIRYTTKFVSFKDIKSFMKDLKKVYQADTEQLAVDALDELDEKWG